MSGPVDFGDYVLQQRIGKGGMAEVFLAYRKRGGVEPVCVKRVLPAFLEEERFSQMFFDEARLAQKLMHPNVVQVFDAGAVDGRPYLTMEHVDGPSLERLRRRLKERQELLPIEVCVDVLVQLSRALHYVHRVEVDGAPLNVVHRDVSPGNVLLRRDGTVKLTDFGVARAADRVTRTQTGLTKGKCPYMSPEQARAEPVDHRTDQFAAGIILWEFLTGQLLFDAETTVATLERVVARPIPAPSTIRKGVPKRLDDLVLRALERDRDKRFEDMAAFERALEATVLPVGVDDRESRLQGELARVDPPVDEGRPVLSSDRAAPALEVERALTDIGLDASWKTSAEIEARAVPLEGAHLPYDGAAVPKRRGRGAAVLVVMALLLAAVAFGVTSAKDTVTALPFMASWLQKDEQPPAATPEAITPETVLPPVVRPSVKGAEKKADGLERDAALQLLQGKAGAALKLLRRAVDLSPNRSSLHRKLGMAYRDLGERYLAQRHLERYLELAPRADDRGQVKALIEELREP